MGLIVASLLFGFQLGVIFAVVMVGFASAAILYYTSQVLRYYRTDQHVAATRDPVRLRRPAVLLGLTDPNLA